MLRMKWPDTLKKLMKEQGETQETLAEKLGVSQSLLSAYFREGRTPPLKRLKQIADYFGKKPRELLEDNEENITTGNEIKDGLKVKSLLEYKFYPLLTIDEVLEWKANPKSKPYRVIKMIHSASSPNKENGYVLDLTDEFRKIGSLSGFFSNRRIYGIFELSRKPENEDIVMVKIKDNLIIRKYMKDGTIIILKSFDPNTNDTLLNSEMEIIAIAKNIYNGEAEITESK